jgi:hypothetical protein
MVAVPGPCGYRVVWLLAPLPTTSTAKFDLLIHNGGVVDGFGPRSGWPGIVLMRKDLEEEINHRDTENTEGRQTQRKRKRK